MNSHQFWLAFMDTGAPEMYLLFNKARKLEEDNVFNNNGSGASGGQL